MRFKLVIDFKDNISYRQNSSPVTWIQHSRMISDIRANPFQLPIKLGSLYSHILHNRSISSNRTDVYNCKTVLILFTSLVLL